LDLSSDKIVSNNNNKKLNKRTDDILKMAKELCKNDNLEDDYYPDNTLLISNMKK
jgi:hypothetical protein